MFRLLLLISLLILFFGWIAGMAIYKIAQLVFLLVASIIMLMMGSIIFSLTSKGYGNAQRIRV